MSNTKSVRYLSWDGCQESTSFLRERLRWRFSGYFWLGRTGSWVWLGGKEGRSEYMSSSFSPPLSYRSMASESTLLDFTVLSFRKPAFWYFLGAVSNGGNLLNMEQSQSQSASYDWLIRSINPTSRLPSDSHLCHVSYPQYLGVPYAAFLSCEYYL